VHLPQAEERKAIEQRDEAEAEVADRGVVGVALETETSRRDHRQRENPVTPFGCPI